MSQDADMKKNEDSPAPEATATATEQATAEVPATTDAAGSTSPGAAPAGDAAAAFSSSSLYIGDLLTDVTEAQLFETFNAAGPVASIRVCRDSVTRRSLGYAYVNFHNAADAERALDTLNYTPIKGQPCRIMWSQRDPAVRKTGVGNVFIKSLDKSIDNKALYDTFSAFGNILSCKVVLDEHGNSKGYGFVHFETAEAAESAISKVDGMQLNDKVVFVGHFVPRKERQEALGESTSKFTNVFVKNISEEVTEQMMHDEFSKHGKINSSVLMHDDAGASRGFGFVCFDDCEAAAKAVEALNGQEVWGKPLFVGRAQKKSEREAELKRRYEELKNERMNQYQGVNLYVKHIDDTIDEDRLRQEFAHCGTITSTKIMRDDKGTSKGFGFVCFTNPEEATKAVTEMNNKMLAGKPLYVALAQRGSERRAQLAAQYAQRNTHTSMRMQAAALGGMAPPAMYPGGQAAFMYGNPMGPQGGMRGGPGGMMYPTQMPVRTRWQQNPQGGQMQQQMRGMYGGNQMGMSHGQSNGMQRGPGGGGRGGRGGQMGGNSRGGNMQMGGMMGGNRGHMGGYGQKQMMPQQMPMGMPMQQAAMAPVIHGEEPLTASALAAANPERQKIMIGERLFPLIHSAHPDLAGKITGMLLEMDNTELLHLLENSEELNSKVDEAVQVLHAHQRQMESGEQVAAQ